MRINLAIYYLLLGHLDYFGYTSYLHYTLWIFYDLLVVN